MRLKQTKWWGGQDRLEDLEIKDRNMRAVQRDIERRAS